jgi:hypothetical protein
MRTDPAYRCQRRARRLDHGAGRGHRWLQARSGRGRRGTRWCGRGRFRGGHFGRVRGSRSRRVGGGGRRENLGPAVAGEGVGGHRREGAGEGQSAGQRAPRDARDASESRVARLNRIAAHRGTVAAGPEGMLKDWLRESNDQRGRPRAPLVWSGRGGIRSSTTAPPSGWLAADAEPPSASATWRAMARPSPEPGIPRAAGAR